MTTFGPIDEIFMRFHTYGDAAYIGEPVSQTEHMLQTAHVAEQDNSHSTLVAAALLHDYGHLVHDLAQDSAEHGIDTRHEELGYEALRLHFPDAVVEPMRMHVGAKRYLCAVDPAYVEQLSPASIVSLHLQGGPMSPDEVEEFGHSPFASDALRLRRYDDMGKVPGVVVPDLEHYRPILMEILGESHVRTEYRT